LDLADPYAQRVRYPRARASPLTVAITGHTSGIGQALALALQRRGDTVIGMSRANGFDIADVTPIAAAARDADIFVCNAYAGFCQANLLFEFGRLWADHPQRLIIAMSSLSADGIIPSQGRYAIHKKALDAACEQLQADPKVKCRLALLRFGYTDTPRVAQRQVRKLKPDDVVAHTLYAIDQAPGKYLLRLDFRVHYEVPT
jgi:NAD(P)-dependent dehydrogenase (short-subunit alcohol dehydrogenase family)